MREVTWDEGPAVVPERSAELLALDDALEALTRQDPRKCRVVELRFFGGLSVEETAEVLKISPQSVLRDWRLASLGRGGRWGYHRRQLRDGSS